MYHCELPRAKEGFLQSTSQRLDCPFKLAVELQRDTFGGLKRLWCQYGDAARYAA